MFHTNRNDVIESDDIQDVQHIHITQENGGPVAWIKAILDPRKDYQALKDVWMHLSNGINQPRMLGPFEHAQPVPVAAPATEASALATTPQGEASTAEVGTDNSTADDTNKSSTVSPKNGKGN
jgi:hypothetical protein